MRRLLRWLVGVPGPAAVAQDPPKKARRAPVELPLERRVQLLEERLDWMYADLNKLRGKITGADRLEKTVNCIDCGRAFLAIEVGEALGECEDCSELVCLECQETHDCEAPDAGSDPVPANPEVPRVPAAVR